MTAPPNITDHEYEQASTTFRHYSGLRYAILTVLIAINAALIPAIYGKDAFATTPFLAWSLRSLGLISVAAFWWIEHTLDAYLTQFSSFLVTARPDSHWGRRPESLRLRVKFATMSVHASLALFWLASFKDVAG